MMLLTIALLSATASPDGFERRGLLGADRLAVAAVDAAGATRPAKDLWWSGEGQQVLELLDHRACLGDASGCRLGGPLPAELVGLRRRVEGQRVRYELPSASQRVVGWEVVGTDRVLWSWTEKPAAIAMPAVVAAPTVESTPPSPQPSAPWPPILPLGLALAAGFVAAWWLARRRREDAVDWAEIAASLQGELEQSRLGHEVEVARLRRQLEAAEQAFAARPTVIDETVQRRADQLDDRLHCARGRWREIAEGWVTEAAVSRQDAVRFVAPLQQLDGMLLQLERRMVVLGDAAYAQQLRRRRVGLASFRERLRQHLDEHVVLDQRAFQQDLKAMAEALELAQRSAETVKAPSRSLKVLRGGR